jgi:hypothetical protein
VIVAGDFNAVREEFVYGNGPDFFATPSVTAVEPKLAHPTVGAELAPDELLPAIARLDEESGGLVLVCDGVDGGELREVAPLDTALCTRSGSTMVIDFVFMGTVGCANHVNGEIDDCVCAHPWTGNG